GLPAGAADAIFLSTRGIVLLPQPEANGFAGACEILWRKKIFNVGVNQHQGAVLFGGNTAGFSIRQFNLIRGEKAGDAGEIVVGAQGDDGRDIGLIPSVGGGHQRQTAGKAEAHDADWSTELLMQRAGGVANGVNGAGINAVG